MSRAPLPSHVDVERAIAELRVMQAHLEWGATPRLMERAQSLERMATWLELELGPMLAELGADVCLCGVTPCVCMPRVSAAELLSPESVRRVLLERIWPPGSPGSSSSALQHFRPSLVVSGGDCSGQPSCTCVACLARGRASITGERKTRAVLELELTGVPLTTRPSRPPPNAYRSPSGRHFCCGTECPGLDYAADRAAGVAHPPSCLGAHQLHQGKTRAELELERGAPHGRCDECGSALCHYTGPEAGGVLCPLCDVEHVHELVALNGAELNSGDDMNGPHAPLCAQCGMPTNTIDREGRCASCRRRECGRYTNRSNVAVQFTGGVAGVRPRGLCAECGLTLVWFEGPGGLDRPQCPRCDA